ncbi:MAG TPA: UDP-N-acetylmuramoyl-L-alanyl-D-glutamate--2,6-diaminopimelate ligase [Steroidobacteraceae bacterium]|jgi:UDP-N-acetylmuramoyl-L-alanyl-D-glutamate--2,6-diaminopimelate ligase
MNVDTQTTWRPLKALLGGLVDVPERLEVSDITQDSRSVTPGAAFLACRGRTHHGLEFAHSAVAAGARAILWEPAPGVSPPPLAADVVVCAVPNLSAQLGFIADRFFDAPSARVTLAGITGTNGKTTCAWLLAQALEYCGRRTAYIGTLGAGTAAALRPMAHTTPDALTLHRELARMLSQGVDSVAMEVSSHALDQERCAGVRFHTAVFTNLTRDHLDYHGSMQAYGGAKARLFNWPTLVARVINVDDPFGLELARSRLQTGASQQRPNERLFVTSQRPAEWVASGADYVCASAVEACAHGLRIQVQSSRGATRLDSSLIGDFNVDNLLSVLAVLLAWDLPLQRACDALARCTAPPGRMQAIGGDGQPLALVDYAHTPDALSKALHAARAHCRGRLWCVFGAGGERDPGKRSEMGRIAAALADIIIVTDDNPRREDPHAIVEAIMNGVTAAGAAARARVMHDRRRAIHAALELAAARDVVLIAGKGHEAYQIVGNERRAFSDAAVVAEALAERVR